MTSADQQGVPERPVQGQPLPPPPPAAIATEWPGARDGLVAFAELLATVGVARGLIGPREVPRLWDRHLVNCAVVEGAVPRGASLADVGSGAGLPGLVLALVRPDCRVTLIEPLLRRATFLQEAVSALGLLDRVEVRRERAEQTTGRWDVVTARAVAPLERLAGWCLPLVRPGGLLLAMKGDRAADELAEARPTLARLGATEALVQRVGEGVVTPPTTLVVVRAGDLPVDGAPSGRRSTEGSGRARRRST